MVQRWPREQGTERTRAGRKENGLQGQVKTAEGPPLQSSYPELTKDAPKDLEYLRNSSRFCAPRGWWRELRGPFPVCPQGGGRSEPSGKMPMSATYMRPALGNLPFETLPRSLAARTWPPSSLGSSSSKQPSEIRRKGGPAWDLENLPVLQREADEGWGAIRGRKPSWLGSDRPCSAPVWPSTTVTASQ